MPNTGVNRLVVAIGPPQRYGNDSVAELREHRREVARERGVRRLRGRRTRADPATGVVDRVVAAPQDPVVGGQPEVVELVAGVRHPLAARPADRCALLRASAAQRPGRSRRPGRTGDGSGGAPSRCRRSWRAPRARSRSAPPTRAHHDPCPHPGRDRNPDWSRRSPRRAAPPPPRARGTASPGRGCRRRRAGGSLPRTTGEFSRARARSASSTSTWCPNAAFGLRPLLEARQLVLAGRELGAADRLEVGVDPVVVERPAHPGIVLVAERVEPVDLGREVPPTVEQAVGQRRVQEPAVAAGRAVTDHVGLADRDPQTGIALEQLDRGPQPGEPGADDGDVRPQVADQRSGVAQVGRGRARS